MTKFYGVFVTFVWVMMFGLAPISTSFALAPPAPCSGDFDFDGDVDGSDLATFSSDFGRTNCSGDCEGDFDNDGDVDGSDLTLFSASFNRTDCPIPLPEAKDDSYDALGNVFIDVDASNGLLANDHNGVPLTVTAFNNPSANGGNVNVNSDGSFTYNPPPGFEGIDTFSYTIQDINGITDSAAVFIDVSNMVWFIDNSAVAGGDGRLSAPFNSVAAYGAAADETGDTIFLFEGTATYTPGFVLKNDQQLIGEGAGLTSITPPPYSAPLPSAGARPVLGGNPAVTLAQNNSVRGLDIDATQGIVGNTVSTATISSISINSSGARALDIQNGFLSAILDSVTSNGSPNGGIRLAAVGGSLSSGSTAINHTGGAGILVTGSFFGAGDGADFGDTTVNGPAGISLSANGSPATFTFDSLSITASNGHGLHAVNNANATLEITATNNTVSATNGAGVQIINTSIGEPGITFQSISASSGVNGIVLNNTGSHGLTVNGDGGDVQNGSGGSITNTQGDAISLVNTANIELNQMAVNSAGRHGIFGNGVNNLTINHSSFTANGNADNEDALSFRSGGATITGTLTLNNVDITDFNDTGLHVFNSAGSVSINVVNGSDFDDNHDVHGTHGIFVETEGSASASLVVNGSLFNDHEGDIVRFEAGSTGTNDVDILNNRSTNGGGPDNFPNGGGINLLVTNNATLTFDIDNNDLRDMRGDIINIVGTAGGGNMEGRIVNNTISGGVGTSGDGIRIDNGGVNPSGIEVWTILVQDNSIGVDDIAGTFNGLGDDGIQVLFSDSNGTLNLTVEDNTIANTSSEGIRMFFDEDTGLGSGNPRANIRIVDNNFSNVGRPESIYLYNRDTSQACYHMTGNTIVGEIRLRERDSAFTEITQSSSAALSAANFGAVVNVSDNPISFNGSCFNPPLPTN